MRLIPRTLLKKSFILATSRIPFLYNLKSGISSVAIESAKEDIDYTLSGEPVETSYINSTASVHLLDNIYQFSTAMGKKFYAVRRGRSTGIFETWDECERQVRGYPSAQFKSFPTRDQALSFIKGESNLGPPKNHVETLDPRQSFQSSPMLPPPPATSARLLSPPAGRQVVYTDGSSLSNGKADSRAGYGVYWGPDDPRNESGRMVGKQTNQRGEIMAALRAIEGCLNPKADIEILTDSQYVINSMTKWIINWEKNNWVSATKNPVENKDLLQRLRDAIKAHRGAVIWTHVRAHIGIHGNEMADRLAKAGAMMPLPKAPEPSAQISASRSSSSVTSLKVSSGSAEKKSPLRVVRDLSKSSSKSPANRVVKRKPFVRRTNIDTGEIIHFV